MDFGKLDDEEGRNRGGTGLGLSICKQIIEQMGGSVEVKSKLGRGTDFVINMKIKSRSTVAVMESPAAYEKYLENIESADSEPE